MCELVSEDCPNGLLVVHVVGEVHKDRISVDVGVFRRVDSSELLVVDKHGNMRRDSGARAKGLWRSCRAEGWQSTHGGIRLGAAVHSASQLEAVRLWCVKRGS